MGVLRLGKGFSVRTFNLPPAGFDPDKASDRERTVYGIPRCPVAFKALEQRMRMKLRNVRLIEPVFKPRDRKKTLPGLRRPHGPETTTIWSGGITFPPSGDTMKWVEGTWTMPRDVVPSGASSGVWYSASTWVGIDGDDGSGDVLQAGCDADVMSSDGSTQKQFNPWWEWYPGGSFWITNMPVAAGNELTCLICRHQGSSNQATIYLGNVSTNTGLWFQPTAPAGISLSGNCAEWIVEALEINTDAPELARYTTVTFADCNAGTVGGSTVNLSTGNTINMVNGSNQVISEGSIVNQSEVTVSYV
jgi:hypothetical protein